MSLTTMPQIQFYVQDVSYVEPNFSGDRVVFIPILSPKGPDKTIELMSSPTQIERVYGKPDPEKYGFGLHFALKASLYTNKVYLIRVLPDDATLANKRISVNINDYSPNPVVQNNYTDATDIELDDVSKISINDKIFFNKDINNVYTVVNIDTSSNTITLDKPVSVNTGAIVHKVPVVTLDSVSNANSVEELKGDPGFNDSVFTFYPIGRGEFYNKIKISFVRNTTLEQMYVDEKGDPLFPYMFVDIYVYEEQEDGSVKLLEGPITASLVNKIAGNTVRHPTTGRELYIVTRINEDSEFIRVIANEDKVKSLYGAGANDVEALYARKLVVESFSDQINFENGSDGSLFDSFGKLDWSVANKLLTSVFNGTYSEDCVKLLDTQYQYYPIDYVVDPGYPLTVKAAMREFCDVREDVLGLISMPFNTKYTQDIESRLNDVPYATYNVMLYSQYRKMTDPYTGKTVWFPPTYHALECHLNVDNTQGIAEPVAMFKAFIQDPIELSYSPIFAQANELTNRQINPTIKEPDGTYIPTQFTTYKRLSILQRAHVVKVIHTFRKEIPKILKDLLQRKATTNVIKEAYRRVNNYLKQWLEGGPLFTKEAIKEYKLNVRFDDTSSTLYIDLDVKFIRAIEFIVVSLKVR